LEHASNRNEPFAVAMIDCMMPVMDGFELAKCIRQSPGLSSLKILMLTSAGPDAGMESIQNLGIDACLLKPIHQSNLYNTLVRVMSNSGRQPFQAAEPTSARIPTTRRPLKILLAEDNAFNQKVAMGMLSHMGHAVTVVTNGHEAVNAFGGDRFDLILMDVQMPYMDGFEATRRIRAMEALNDGKRLPIIAMTAYAMKGDREKCLDAGMDGYLAKPVNSRELASVIENVSSHFNASECSDLRGLDGKAVVNLSGLLESVGGNRELLDEMLAIFSEDSPKLMSEIALAIGNQDPDGLRIAAHSLKSMVAGLGASSAVEAALRLENMGRSLDMAYAREALVILENELNIVHEALAGDGRDADI
jgi:two-component system, sensor histidine kinase and response regulator